LDDREPREVEASGPVEEPLGQAPLMARPAGPRAQVSGTAARTRPAPRPFSAYAQEYRYVASDLRRVAVVGGGLLLALIVLAFFIR
jgi:hypothetical protein